MSFIIIPASNPVNAFQIDYVCSATFTGSDTAVTWAANATITSSSVSRTNNTTLTLAAGTYELLAQYSAVMQVADCYGFLRVSTNDGTTTTSISRTVTGRATTGGIESLRWAGNSNFGFILTVVNTLTFFIGVRNNAGTNGDFAGSVYLLKTA